MNFKEKFKKFLDEKRLDREIKIARKNISDKEKERVQVVGNNFEKFNDSKEKQTQNFDNKTETKKENKTLKFNFERLKDAGLIAVAVMLVGIGYANFSGKDDITNNQVLQTASEYSNNLGDVQLVSSDNTKMVENDNNTNSVNNANDTNLVNSENIVNVTTSSEALNSVTSSSTTSTSEYFKELKLDRDNMYSEKLEAYQKIVDSTSISSEQKAIAIQEIEKITEVQNLIEISEELIKLKGFEDVVIYVNENAVTVIVRSADLTSSQVAQIQSIVTRQLNVEATNISISNK